MWIIMAAKKSIEVKEDFGFYMAEFSISGNSNYSQELMTKPTIGQRLSQIKHNLKNIYSLPIT